MKTKAPAHGSAEHRAQLWDAINEYVESCGATPGARMYGNTKRQLAVAEIEALVYPPNTQMETCAGCLASLLFAPVEAPRKPA